MARTQILGPIHREFIAAAYPVLEQGQKVRPENEERRLQLTWRYSRKITALFVGYEDTNAWAYFSGDGWKKFREDQEDAHINMANYAAHAKGHDRFVDYDEDPAGFVRTMYVW